MPFEDKVRQEAIDRITQALIKGRMAQAYLIVGPIRDAAQPFAVEILQHIFCEKTPDACGECAICRQVRDRLHPDVFWLEPQLKSRVIGVEDIRDLQKPIFLTSFVGGWKAAVIVGADRLGVAGKEEAANAFLKTLEEPPPRTLFLLLTDSPDMVLPTILSRCQRVILKTAMFSLAEERLADLLEIFQMSKTTGPLLSSLARAHRFATIMEGVRKEIEAQEKDIKAESEAGVDKETFVARVEARAREERTSLLRAMKVWYRDLLLCVCGADPALLSFQDHREILKTMAERLTCRQALENIEAIENMQRQFSRNIAEDVVLTMGFARLSA